jgi:hypothetical protein
MARKFYTIDDLYMFCKDNQFEKFNSAEYGAPLVIQSIGTFESESKVVDGLLPVTLKSCHTGKNANRSGISDSTMKECKQSFQGRPILGAIYKTDTGEYEFRSHDMEIVQDDDGNTEIEYIEQPIGVISQTEDPYLEFDDELEKNFLMVKGTIFADYSRAAEILQRRRTCKCSVEIEIEEMSYNCAEDYLSIDKFQFRGVTILGYEQDGTTEIQEGMKGSKITIDSFSEEKNSMFAVNYQDKLVEVLDKLNTTLSNFNRQETQEGGDAGMGKFEELLEKYGKAIEDIEFEYEEMTDEELEAKFAELFDGEGDDSGDAGAEGDTDGAGEDGDTTDAEEGTDPEAEVVEQEDDGEGEAEEGDESTEGEEDGDDNSVNTDDDTSKKKKGFELVFELSHDDVRCGLYSLLRTQSEDSYWYGWILDVYDSYFIYEDYNDDVRYYRQKYTRDDENLAFDGEPVEIFSEWLTQEEKDALAALKAEYAELKAFKEKYDADELKALKDAIFEMPEYADIKETEEFQALIKEADKYSVEDLRIKADLLFANSMKKKFNFEAEKPENTHSVGVHINAQPDPKKQAYAGLFADEDK